MQIGLIQRAARLIGLGVLGVATGLGLCEAGLRLTGFQQPKLLAPQNGRHEGGPGANFVYQGHMIGGFVDFANPVTLNTQGFHDVEHLDDRAKTNTFRLMIVGDSYVAALSIPLEKTFFRLIENRFARQDPLGCASYEVIAMGRGNQAQQKEIEYITKFAPRFRPDAILLLLFTGNDFMENSLTTFKAAADFGLRFQHKIAPAKFSCFNRCLCLPRSRLNGLVAAAVTSFYAMHLYWFRDDIRPEDLISPELGVYRLPLAPEWEAAYARTGRLLEAMRNAAQAEGAMFLIACLDGPQAIGDVGPHLLEQRSQKGLILDYPSKWVAAWCASNDVPFCSLAPALQKLGRRAFWPHDGHLNEQGNQAIVEPLCDFVVSKIR